MGKKVLHPQRYINNSLTICLNYFKKILYFLTAFIFFFFRMSSPGLNESCLTITESCSFSYPDNAYSSDFCFQVEAKNVLGASLTECVPIPLQKIGN